MRNKSIHGLHQTAKWLTRYDIPKFALQNGITTSRNVKKTAKRLGHFSIFFFFSEGSRTRDWVSVHMVSDRSTDAATICERLAGQASGRLLRPAGCWMMGESLVNLQPGQGRAHPPSQHTPDNLQCLGSNPGLPGGIAWFPCFQTSCLIVTRWGCR